MECSGFAAIGLTFVVVAGVLVIGWGIWWLFWVTDAIREVYDNWRVFGMFGPHWTPNEPLLRSDYNRTYTDPQNKVAELKRRIEDLEGAGANRKRNS